jgi:hypothetical protein
MSIATGALACASVAAAIAGSAASLIIATGFSGAARHTLRFGFGGVEHSARGATQIAIHNGRYAAGTLVCALLRSSLPQWARLLSDLLLATTLALNAAAIGIAVGAYRGRAVAATAPHLPVEVVGLSLAGGAYLHARTQPFSRRALIATAAASALLLGAAALIETYGSMGGAQ